MEELVQFLRDRLDEDEREAKSVLWEGSGNSMDWELTASATVFTGEDEFYAVDRTVARHIARHDPARVVADVEAKQQLLKLHAKSSEYDGCVLCDVGWRSCGCMGTVHWSYPCDTVKVLALAYADHPAYREDWRP